MADSLIIEPAAPRMLPRVTDTNRTFWTGGAQGRLMVTRCTSCRRWVLPLSEICPECDGATIYEATTGRATVFTYTLNAHQFHPDVPPPNLIAIVILDEQEDLRLATNIVDCEEDEICCGMAVTVLFEKHGEMFYPVFTPDEEK